MAAAIDLRTLASEMKAAQDSARQIEPFTMRLPDFDLAAAYEVAQLVHRARLKEGARALGRKIGFTNPDMWSTFGVREPIWAYIYDTTVTFPGRHARDAPARRIRRAEDRTRDRLPVSHGPADGRGTRRDSGRGRLGGTRLRDRAVALPRLEVPGSGYRRRLGAPRHAADRPPAAFASAWDRRRCRARVLLARSVVWRSARRNGKGLQCPGQSATCDLAPVVGVGEGAR